MLFYIGYGFAWLVTLLPLQVLYLLSDFLYILAFYILGYRKKVVFENLAHSFPEKTEEERVQIAKKFYRHLCDTIVEMAKIIHINPKQIEKRFRFKNIELLDHYYEQNRSLIAISGHYGNWEWLNVIARHLKHKGLAVYLPLNNKKVDKLMVDFRAKFGGNMVTIYQIVREMLKHQQKNELTISYFLADQSPHVNKIEYWTTFMNQETPVFLGPEKIARKTNQVVLFLDIQKVKRGYYEAEFTTLCENPKDTKEFELTEMHVKKLESIIRKTPQYWLWSHRRWKEKREKVAEYLANQKKHKDIENNQ